MKLQETLTKCKETPKDERKENFTIVQSLLKESDKTIIMVESEIKKDNSKIHELLSDSSVQKAPSQKDIKDCAKNCDKKASDAGIATSDVLI